MMTIRNNHYVPEWYQEGFSDKEKLFYLNLSPDEIINKRTGETVLEDGKPKTYPPLKKYQVPAQCFYQTDLYSTFFGAFINDEIERMLFGAIDDQGAEAIRAFIGDDFQKRHQQFENLFSYIDAQKIRTPKGLEWIKGRYPNLDQNGLMMEMQAIRQANCTIWAEAVREIVSAKDSDVKFIISDHPVTIYNPSLPPSSKECTYPNEPSIALKGTQTIFPLDKDHCLILTNYEYAKNPNKANPLERRTNARNYRNTLIHTERLIRVRKLDSRQVSTINFLLKNRAKRYVASPVEELLYPEKIISPAWIEIKDVLLPPSKELWQFGGQIYIGYKDGTTAYQDVFGRSRPENSYLKKKQEIDPEPNAPCGCGSAKAFKYCCKELNKTARPISWKTMSLRERNLGFIKGVSNVLGIRDGKTWDDIRRELSDEHIKAIHELYDFFWPYDDTDIINLLPKPDGALRALYTGIIDPKYICRFATSLIPYFDEVLIQHPFMHPKCVSPEFSPILSPHQHKQQTLKNLFLLFELEPFIRFGYVNFFPDPCFFDPYLQKQMFIMSKARAGKTEIDEGEDEILQELAKETFERSIYSLSTERKRAFLKRSNAPISEKEINDVIAYMEVKREADCFALLQDDAIIGGQLSYLTMAPNFELALYIAQTTGAFVLTDSPYRWKELINAQSKYQGNVKYYWRYLSDSINGLEYPLNLMLNEIFYIRKSGKLSSFRETVGDIYNKIQREGIPPFDLVVKSRDQYLKAYAASQEELGKLGENEAKCNLQFLMPHGGIVHNNVQRLLISTGCDHHLSSVPMAIFAKFTT